jgi:hypothetical protein
VSPVQIGVAQAPEQGLQLAEDLPRRLDRHHSDTAAILGK